MEQDNELMLYKVNRRLLIKTSGYDGATEQ